MMPFHLVIKCMAILQKKRNTVNFCKLEEIVVLDSRTSWDNKCVTDRSRDSKQVDQHEIVPWF